MFTVTHVGSWPRSPRLLRAMRDRHQGRIERRAFAEVADAEVRACVQAQLDAGVDLIVDGEVRRDNFYSFITERVDGTDLMRTRPVSRRC